MRDNFSKAVGGKPESRFAHSQSSFERLFQRLESLVEANRFQGLKHEKLDDGNEEISLLSSSFYYKYSLILKPDGKCIVDEKWNDVDHVGPRTGKMSYADAAQLFTGKIASQFPRAAREGVRNYLSNHQDCVQVAGQKFELV